MNEQRGPIIDSTPRVDGRTSIKGQIRDIKEARNWVNEQNSILSQGVVDASNKIETQGLSTTSVAELKDALKALTDQVKENIKNGTAEQKARAKQIKAILDQTGAEKDMERLYKSIGGTLEKHEKIMKSTNAKWEDAFDDIDNIENALDTFGQLTDIVDDLTDSTKKLTKAQQEQLTKNYNASKQNSQIASGARKGDKAIYGNRSKEADQKLSKAVNEQLDKLGTTLKGAIDTLNLKKLADAAGQFAPTARQKLQADLQTNYNLTNSQFESFKKDLYKQIDTSLYSDEEIKGAMQALNTTALGSTKTATAYFKDLVTGQKVLGLQAETQKRLLELGNITGRNELTFYQNQVAKYLNSSLGLNKQQLDELVNINAGLQTQAADIGIATEEFRQMSMNETSAFEKTNKGFGAKYTQSISSLLANTDTAAALLGMDSGELSGRLARGESFISLLQRGQGSSVALDVLRNGTAEEQTRYYEHAKAAWGIDANTWSVLRVIAQQGSELNKNLRTATDASKQNADDAMEELEKKEFGTLTGTQKTVNAIQNFFERSFSWNFINKITNIGTAIVMAISALRIGSSVGDLLSLFRGGKGAEGDEVVKAAKGIKGGGGFLSKFHIGKATGMKALGGAGLLLAGGAIGVHDASKMSHGAGLDWGDVRGFAFGTGHSKQSTGDAWGSALGNGAKWGAIGAGLGTFIGGPGVGTAIGAGIGLVGGTILGGLAHLMDKKEKSEEEKAKEKQAETAAYLKEIRQNTATTALNTAKSGIGMSFLYRGKSNYSVGVGSPAGIGGKGESTGLKYGVTSSYGQRAPVHVDTDNDGIKDSWTQPFHSGTDFGAPEGTPLYSNVTGTVASTGKDGAGANYVGVTGPGGFTHWYWHMMKPAVVSKGQHVVQGQLVGYVGHTGVNAGSHLHYTVTKPGRLDWWQRADPTKGIEESTVNSLPFATPAIFDGNGSYAAYLPTEGSTIQSDLSTSKGYTLTNSHLGDIATPIVNSIGDLKQTIIDLSNRTSRNEQIMNSLVNRTMQSPTV